MLGKLLGDFIDKEKIIKDYLEETISDVSQELQCGEDELFIMIKPVKKESSEFRVFLYKVVPGSSPKMVREMKLKEFVNHE